MPILQLTRRGLTCEEAEWTRLVDEFRERHSIQIRALVEPALVRVIQRGIEQAGFDERRHAAFATELCLREHDCLDLLHFLVNDQQLFDRVAQLADGVAVKIFLGRIYRHLPRQHFANWHADDLYDRAVGMSINLSADRFEGGVFEIREAGSGRVVNAIPNVGPGDAILFQISERLEHRVTAVEGSIPKTAFAGWFSTAPDYFAALRPNLPERLRASAPPPATPAPHN